MNNEIDYKALNVEEPLHIPHYTPEQMETFKIPVGKTWKQRGNTIYREGEEIELHTTIPTNKILVGTDADGNPILENIKV